MKRSRLPILTIPLLILLAGCSTPEDERLYQLTQESLARQAEQNEIIAQQSNDVTRQTAELIDANAQARRDTIELQRELVESEAAARNELVAIQQDLVQRDADGRQELTQLQHAAQESFAAERQSADRQLEELAAERQQIAHERQRAPIVAAAVQQFGLILACLAPLVLAAYLLHTLRQTSDDDAAVIELLVAELANPKLLPTSGGLPMLPGRAPPDDSASSSLDLPDDPIS